MFPLQFNQRSRSTAFPFTEPEDSGPRHVFTQASVQLWCVSKRLLLPWQPPYQNWAQALAKGSQYHFTSQFLHGPGSRRSVQPAAETHVSHVTEFCLDYAFTRGPQNVSVLFHFIDLFQIYSFYFYLNFLEKVQKLLVEPSYFSAEDDDDADDDHTIAHFWIQMIEAKSTTIKAIILYRVNVILK